MKEREKLHEEQTESRCNTFALKRGKEQTHMIPLTSSPIPFFLTIFYYCPNLS
jgi:hypothetical protein